MNESHNNHEDTQKIENASHNVDSEQKDNHSHGTDPKHEIKHETEHSPDNKEPSTDVSKSVEKEENALGQSVFKVFADAVLQRKKSSYDKFHLWEQQRAAKIYSYRSICENILERLLSKTSASIDGTEGVIR